MLHEGGGTQMNMSLVVAAAATLLTFGTTANAQTLKEQEMCASQAKQYFLENKAERVVWADYESHYNKKLGKCFVLVKQMIPPIVDGGGFGVQADLSDAYERHMYGFFHSMSSKVTLCELTPIIGERRICESRKEFDALIAPYMQE
jgi:hypothetical protein